MLIALMILLVLAAAAVGATARALLRDGHGEGRDKHVLRPAKDWSEFLR